MEKGDIERILEALATAGVDYLVAGGVAVVLHGHPRFTADLDLFLHLEPENVRRAMRALADLGFRPRLPVEADAFADPATRRRWIEDKGLVVFSLWSDRLPATVVDIFAEEPLPFAEARARGVRVDLGPTVLVVVSLDDLVTMKRTAGRPRDLEDVEALLAIRKAGDA